MPVSRRHVRQKDEQMTQTRARPTDRPPAGRAIHVVVDLNRCQSYAQCCFLAPSVFKLHGEEALWYVPEPDASQRESIMRAAAACPVQAILVEWPEANGRQKTGEAHE